MDIAKSSRIRRLDCSSPSRRSYPDLSLGHHRGPRGVWHSFNIKDSLLYSSIITDISIDKIRKLSFAIIHSTTIALPAWHKACTANSRPIHLIPRDVKTRWNSTYDMLTVAFDYRTVIDDITANKSLKLRRYELDDQDWEVVEDLLRVLKVCFFLPRQCTIQLMASSDV
jgi:hypothetical protein